MNEASPVETEAAKINISEETAIECCAVCFELFDMRNGFGWGVSGHSSKPEFFCAECYPTVDSETHSFIEWNGPVE